MTQTTVNGVALDWKAQEVLEAIVESGGEASTSEVKHYTGLERNEVVKYRFAKLAEAGIIKTRQPESENGRPAAKVATLTDEGDSLLSDGGLDFEVNPGDDALTLDERVERVEKQLKRMRSTYGEVKERIVEIEDEVDDHDEDLDDLVEDIKNVKKFLAEKDF